MTTPSSANPSITTPAAAASASSSTACCPNPRRQLTQGAPEQRAIASGRVGLSCARAESIKPA